MLAMVSRKWLDTRSVIPAKAGSQLTLLWITLPWKGRKDDREDGMLRNFANVKLFT
jgi:hypothetical protein|tara:strand:- start:21 stop:188 length:168 start_codon:yes stop_codon:yes gene_type:complete